MEKAVDTKIEDQAGFVQWWKETVDEKRAPRSARTFSMNDAEEQTGIKHQQISRWRHYLSNTDAYRERLLGAEYKARALMEAALNPGFFNAFSQTG